MLSKPTKYALPPASAALLSACVLTLACQRTAPPAQPPPAEALARPAPAPPRLAGQPALPPDLAKVAAARALMKRAGKEAACGPYRLWTDVEDPRLTAACALLGASLDREVVERFGVVPAGVPREGIILFRRLADYRALVKAEGRLAAGYAGFAIPADGLLVLHADAPRRSVIQTLAHELTHLVEHRAFGSRLPPWLSEGLADAIGDTASEDGYAPLAGTEGVEALARRLRGALARGEARDFLELAALPRSRFDRAVRSYDYEASALWVRHLLLDPDLGPRFRAYLADLTHAERYDTAALIARLGRPEADLERSFAAWLRQSESAAPVRRPSPARADNRRTSALRRPSPSPSGSTIR